ncbi:MAG: transposase [Bacteroidales bacterium]|jgi:transposase|nr:transposase [Bacteroidales bacterium]
MKTKRRKFSAGFKAQVAIEAIKERETLAELSKRLDVHPNMISKWKQEFIERSSEIFNSKAPEENFEVEKERLFAKIGQLEMDRDWLKKISKRAGL